MKSIEKARHAAPFKTLAATLVTALWMTTQVAAYEEDREPRSHPIHSRERPLPPPVNPGPHVSLPAPSDAIVLFDGSDFNHWQHSGGRNVDWKLEDHAMRVVPGTGDIETRRLFGDVQLYVEFQTYKESPGKDQTRSNSGVFFGPYEVQILDSYDNPTYADGVVASIFGQYPPLVNASRPAGEWQSLNIIYRAPRFENGKVLAPARITVFHNHILVQDHEALVGPTTFGQRTPYTEHGDVRIRLQDHRDDPIRFRNIWIRPLD
jgi:hypothetical protein